MSKKILIIDDSGFSRKVMRKILETGGYTVVEASDGMDALEVFAIENPDAVFLDLNMPGMNGLDVISKLMQLNPAVRIAIASADIQDSTKKIALELGAKVYLHKPLNETIILNTLSNFFE